MHAIVLDSKYDVPTVAIHTNVFEKAVQSVTRMHGMPGARYTLLAGLYRPEDLVRIPVADPGGQRFPEDAVPLQTIEISAP